MSALKYETLPDPSGLLRRPELLAFTAMCEARIATWDNQPTEPERG